MKKHKNKHVENNAAAERLADYRGENAGGLVLFFGWRNTLLIHTMRTNNMLLGCLELSLATHLLMRWYFVI